MIHEFYQSYTENKWYGGLDVYFNGDINTHRKIKYLKGLRRQNSCIPKKFTILKVYFNTSDIILISYQIFHFLLFSTLLERYLILTTGMPVYNHCLYQDINGLFSIPPTRTLNFSSKSVFYVPELASIINSESWSSLYHPRNPYLYLLGFHVMGRRLQYRISSPDRHIKDIFSLMISRHKTVQCL